jgi:hypothetical protein
MLIHLPIIVLTSLHPNSIADTVPIFDIARECQYEGGSKEEEKRCADDETRARDTLQTEWIQFTENAKRQCYEETSIDGTPSYVELAHQGETGLPAGLGRQRAEGCRGAGLIVL